YSISLAARRLVSNPYSLAAIGFIRRIYRKLVRSKRGRIHAAYREVILVNKVFQILLLALGVVSMIFLAGAIVLSALATTHGSTPARVDNVTAGPYRLKVSLYNYPANAGFALPFAIATQAPVQGPLAFSVSSIPGRGVDATPVKASFNPDPYTPGGVQG